MSGSVKSWSLTFQPSHHFHDERKRLIFVAVKPQAVQELFLVRKGLLPKLVPVLK